MNRVFRQASTGDLYAVTDGDMAHNVGLDGKRFYNLQPVQRLVDAKTREPVDMPQHDGRGYRTLSENFAFILTVSEVDFTGEFVVQPQWLDAQNSRLDELMAKFTDEMCNFGDLEWCALVGLRSAQNMSDSLTRCILHALSKHVATLEEARVKPLSG